MVRAFLLTAFLWLAAAYIFVVTYRKYGSGKMSYAMMYRFVMLGGLCVVAGLVNVAFFLYPEPIIAR